MRIFRWLVVASVVTGAITGSGVLYFSLFMPAYSFASSDGTSGSVAASQLTGGHFASSLVFLAIEIVALVVALLSGVMYSVSAQRGWQIVLWIAAIILLLQFALATFSYFATTPGLPPAAILTLLAALFSLGVRQTLDDGDVERQPLMPPVSMPTIATPRGRLGLLLGIALAFSGGVALALLMPVSWVAILITLAVSSIGATLLIRSPLSALVVPAAIWLGAMVAILYNGARNAALGDSTFWWGALEFAAILIAIAVIPALVGVGIGALLTRWLPGASA